MEKTRLELDIQQLYGQDLFNKYYAYKTVNLNLGKRYGPKLLFGSALLILKLFVSRLFRPKELFAGPIFISWSPLHKKRAKDLSEEYRFIEYHRLSFSRDQISFFAHISIRDFLRNLFKIKKSDVVEFENSSLYVRDSFANRILFVLDYLAVRKIVLAADKIFIAGHSDRLALVISKLCKNNKIEFSILQHGILGKKERWMHLQADRFYYLYPFSKPYVKHLIAVTPDTELHYLPKKASSLELKMFDHGIFDRSIAYATSPADSEKDVKIIENLKDTLRYSEYNLLIYPHPLESEITYEHLSEEPWVFISRQRHRNISYIVSRYSTLGIDYHEQGIPPVFLNYDKHKMDFLEENAFLVFQTPFDFEDWIEKSLKAPQIEL